MTRDVGEVAVKQDGHVHAVATPGFDGTVHVDVDGEPHVSVPSEVTVAFSDDGDDEPVETDGGVPATRSDIDMRGGLAMGEELSTWATVLSALGLLSAGYLWGSGVSEVVGILVAAGALCLGWFATGSFWRWRGAEG